MKLVELQSYFYPQQIYLSSRIVEETWCLAFVFEFREPMFNMLSPFAHVTISNGK
jgi:hypothetical protein